MTEISVLYHKVNGLRKDQMRTRHQGGYWNEPVAGGQLQTWIVLVAAEPSVTTHSLYLGVKHKPDALDSQLGSLTTPPPHKKSKWYPSGKQCWKLLSLILWLSYPLRITSLYGQALKSGSSLFLLKLKRKLERKTAATWSIWENEVQRKRAS